MTDTTFLDGRVNLKRGDSRDVLKTIPDNSIDSVVTDPPYALVSIVKRFGKPGSAPAKDGDVYARSSAGFMGQSWDTGETAFAAEFWAEVLRVLKPGGYVLAFSGTRTQHRMVCAIEDAGFEIRDQIGWAFGSGFPKSHDVAKGIAAREKYGSARTEDIRRMQMGEAYEPSGRGRRNYDSGGGSKMNGSVDKAGQDSDTAKQWEGWGSALKPAWEPICVARKPLIGTIAENVLTHGTGAINIDGCRVESEGGTPRINEPSQNRRYADNGSTNFAAMPGPRGGDPAGRFPANLIHDGSDEVVAAFPSEAGGAAPPSQTGSRTTANTFGVYTARSNVFHSDSGSAARFFYSAKADATDRLGSKHPTVKPVDLMQYLVRLVTPKGGTVLDPFAGTGTTGEAAWREGMNAILIEREAEYQADIARRLELADNPTKRAAVAATKNNLDDPETLPLFASQGGAE